MIVRIWHGWTPKEKADQYEELLRTIILPGIKRIPGYQGAHLLRSEEGVETEFVTLTFFSSMAAVKEFAGTDYEVAVVPPAARALLCRFDQRVKHYHTLITPALPLL